MAHHKLLAILLDCGDTLVDEGTEIKDAQFVVQEASLIPGAAAMVQELKQRGYRLGLVADGPAGTFHNILGRKYALLDLFDVLAISELVGVAKPDRRMFQHALNALGIEPGDYGRVVMLGNHLERDIKGANDLGLISVWLDWAPRRSKTPASPAEQPRYIIKSPAELLPLLAQIEADLP
jgi:putative hydrolase of the HAD superfamily